MKRFALLAAPLALGLAAASASAVHVNIELSLLVDVSGSIDDNEYALQRTGYANAFSNLNFNAVIGAGNSVAVNMIEWSSNNQQSVVTTNGAHPDGWWIIASQADAQALGAFIAGIGRSFNSNTAPQDAMTFAAPLIFSNNIVSDKQVIDVSGDGVANSGDINGISGRTNAVNAGVDQINGLVIGGDNAVVNYYQTHIQFGAGSFTNQVANFQAFGSAIAEKLQLEISTGIPLPTTAGLGAAGLLLVGARRRRA